MVDLFTAELHAVLSLQISCQRFDRARSRLQCSVRNVDGAVLAAFPPAGGVDLCHERYTFEIPLVPQ